MSTLKESTRVTIKPAPCPHCHKPVSQPPAWIKLLEAMSPGRGQDDPFMSVAALAKAVGMSRQRASILVDEAVGAGALEIPGNTTGARVYHRTQYGRQILGVWKTAGWRSK
jgi:hypothetical protein